MSVDGILDGMMNDYPSEPKNQPQASLPPLDEECNARLLELQSSAAYDGIRGFGIVDAKLECRERQLRSARTELETLRTALAAKDARIAELKESTTYWATAHQELGFVLAEQDEKLRAVSEVLKEPLPVMVQAGGFYYYKMVDVNAFINRLRAILEGK